MINNNQIKADVRLGREPEIKTVKKDIKVANCSAAISIGKKSENKEPIWVDLVAWRNMAEVLASISKGDAVRVEGYLDENSWEKDGEKHSRLVIVCNTITKVLFPQRKDREPGKDDE